MTLLPPVARFVSASGVRIYRIGCRVLPHLTARVFLLLGAGEPTLVDVGSAAGSSTADILSGIEAIRARFSEPIAVGDIRRIILTHGHIDHFGGLADFTALLGDDVQVAVHPLDREAIVRRDRWAIDGDDRLERFLANAGLDIHQRQEMLWQYRKPLSAAVAAEANNHSDRGSASSAGQNDSRNANAAGIAIDHIENELTIADDMTLDGLRFIHTPGHSPGHVCVLIDDVLLSGDHILSRTLPQQWPESVVPFTGLRHYMSSLQRIESLPGVRLAAGGHEPLIADVYRRIAEIRRAQQRRFQRVQDVIENAPQRLTLQEIGRRVYTQAEGFFALLALTDVGARVEHLAASGKLQIEHDRGVAWVSGI